MAASSRRKFWVSSSSYEFTSSLDQVRVIGLCISFRVSKVLIFLFVFLGYCLHALAALVSIIQNNFLSMLVLVKIFYVLIQIIFTLCVILKNSLCLINREIYIENKLIYRLDLTIFYHIVNVVCGHELTLFDFMSLCPTLSKS